MTTATTPRQPAKRAKGRAHWSTHIWTATSRNHAGQVYAVSSADPVGLLQMALEGDAVAVTLFREHRTKTMDLAGIGIAAPRKERGSR